MTASSSLDPGVLERSLCVVPKGRLVCAELLDEVAGERRESLVVEVDRRLPLQLLLVLELLVALHPERVLAGEYLVRDEAERPNVCSLGGEGTRRTLP